MSTSSEKVGRGRRAMSDGPSLFQNIQREKDGEGSGQTPCERPRELYQPCAAEPGRNGCSQNLTHAPFALHFALNKCRRCEKQPKGMFALLLQAWSAPNWRERVSPCASNLHTPPDHDPAGWELDHGASCSGRTDFLRWRKVHVSSALLTALVCIDSS